MTKNALGVAAALIVATSTIAWAQVRDFKPVSAETLKNPSPDDWLMINRTYDQQRFSPLDEINSTVDH
jgi:glucose dehydrogenase